MDKTVEDIREIVQSSYDLDQIEAALQRLGSLNAEPDIDSDELDSLYSQAIVQLQTLSTGNVTLSLRLIRTYLIPQCLVSEYTQLKSTTYRRTWYRGRLYEWIDNFQAQERALLMNSVLDRLLADLSSPHREAACFTISRLGFRRANIVRALWEIVRSHADDSGDIALFSLCVLGFEENQREIIAHELQRRAVNRFNFPLLQALRMATDKTTLQVVEENWLRNEMQSDVEQRWLVIGLITDLADVYFSDPVFQENAWKTTTDAIDTYSTELTSRLYLGSDVAPHVNVSKVISYLMRKVTSHTSQEERDKNQRYILLLRSFECLRPSQLEGWEGAGTSSVRSLLLIDAQRDTANQTRFPTTEMRLKEMAWEALFSMGDSDVISTESVRKALCEEQNRYIRLSLSSVLACVRFLPLLPEVLTAVTSDFNGRRDSSDAEWAWRMGAIRITRSSGSPEAFFALLNSGFTFEGKVLQESVDALTDVALTLIRYKDQDVARRLVEVAVDSSRTSQRTIALGTLAALAIHGLLEPVHYEALSPLIDDEHLSVFDRSTVIQLIGSAPADIFIPHLSNTLVDLVAQEDIGGDIRWRALEALAQQDQLLQHPHLLENYLHSFMKEGCWLPQTPTTETWRGYIIGIMYRRHQALFDLYVKETITHGEWTELAQLLPALHEFHSNRSEHPISDEVTDALIKRLINRQTRNIAETDLFENVALLAPYALVQVGWDKYWDDWLPDSRVALADALGIATLETEQSQSQAISLMLSLAGDGLFSVRRAAYRSLAKQFVETLEPTAIQWLKSEDHKMRVRAAEAGFWGPLDETHPISNQILEESMRDEEISVRETASRSLEERRNALWAREYLKKVLSVEQGDHDEIMAAWGYSHALGKLGDDETIRALQRHLDTHDLPPHIQHWHRRTIQAIEESWNTKMQKWPDPWVSQRGVIEETGGVIELDMHNRLPVRLSLWRLVSATPVDKSSWGGTAIVQNDEDSHPYRAQSFLISDDNARLRLDDGREGMILIFQSRDETMTFSGQSEYPR